MSGSRGLWLKKIITRGCFSCCSRAYWRAGVTRGQRCPAESVDEVAQQVARLGKGALMAKMNIKQAYRHIPIHPGDRQLLGMQWREKVLIDAALPFGLRLARLIFTAVADAAVWVMQQSG